MENITINEIKSVIEKLPHSKTRVPYTYHHDYLRIRCRLFLNASREYVANNHADTEIELFAICLVQILKNTNAIDAFGLNSEDIAVCNKCIEIAKKSILKHNIQTELTLTK